MVREGTHDRPFLDISSEMKLHKDIRKQELRHTYDQYDDPLIPFVTSEAAVIDWCVEEGSQLIGYLTAGETDSKDQVCLITLS